MVVPKGTPADPTILAAARDLGAPVLTNDRYRDWAEAHPEIRTPGHLIRGGYRDGGLHLDLPEETPRPAPGQPHAPATRPRRDRPRPPSG
jgi:hypothetical protein